MHKAHDNKHLSHDPPRAMRLGGQALERGRAARRRKTIEVLGVGEP